MSVGGAATGRGAGGVAPWPNAAERAAARRAAQEALARSRVRREERERRAAAVPDGAEAAAPHTPAARAAPSAAGIPDADEPIVPIAARPRIEDDTALLGLTRRSNSRVGQRVFNLFFVFVFLLIAIQMVVALLAG
ncbi:MAG: hypothetical protein AB7J32_17315 [Pseudonocardia sp.]